MSKKYGIRADGSWRRTSNCKLCFGRKTIILDGKKTRCACQPMTDEESIARINARAKYTYLEKKREAARRVVQEPRKEDQPVLNG